MYFLFVRNKSASSLWDTSQSSPPLPIDPMVITTSQKFKRIRPQLTDEQKNTRREKFVALTNDIEQARAVYSNKIKNISKKHGRYVFQSVTWTLTYTAIRSERWTSCQLFISSVTRPHRRPTAWNSFIRERLNDINESKLMDFPKFSVAHHTRVFRAGKRLALETYGLYSLIPGDPSA